MLNKDPGKPGEFYFVRISEHFVENALDVFRVANTDFECFHARRARLVRAFIRKLTFFELAGLYYQL